MARRLRIVTLDAELTLLEIRQEAIAPPPPSNHVTTTVVLLTSTKDNGCAETHQVHPYPMSGIGAAPRIDSFSWPLMSVQGNYCLWSGITITEKVCSSVDQQTSEYDSGVLSLVTSKT